MECLWLAILRSVVLEQSAGRRQSQNLRSNEHGTGDQQYVMPPEFGTEHLAVIKGGADPAIWTKFNWSILPRSVYIYPSLPNQTDSLHISPHDRSARRRRRGSLCTTSCVVTQYSRARRTNRCCVCCHKRLAAWSQVVLSNCVRSGNVLVRSQGDYSMCSPSRRPAMTLPWPLCSTRPTSSVIHNPRRSGKLILCVSNFIKR